MVRNKRTVLPTGHPRKYTSNGTTQISQADRIAQNVALVAAGQRKAEKAAEKSVAEARAEADAARAEADAARAEADAARASAATVERGWQAFNDTNLAEAIRQKDAQQRAYKEVYTTACEGLFAAAGIVSATKDGAKLLRKAGDEADKILVSNHHAEHSLLDLDAAFAITDVRRQYELIATIADTKPLARSFQQLREIDKRARARRQK
jgi:hypothetical protein